MYHRPFYHKSQHARRLPSLQHLQGFDGDDRLLTAIANVKVRGRMVFIEDRDDDAEKRQISGIGRYP
jgi:hypothetical protein